MRSKKRAAKSGLRNVKVLGFEAEPKLVEKLDRKAAEQDRSRSWVIRYYVLRGLNQKEQAS